MTAQPQTMVRCERCRAVISSADAAGMIRDRVPCGVCGGTLSLGSARQASDSQPNSSR